jgi:hypothetical protein
MNEFAEFMKMMNEDPEKFNEMQGSVISDKVRDAMTKADEMDKTLIAANLDIFLKKKKSNEHLIKSVALMVTLHTIFAHIMPEDAPNPERTLEQAKRLGVAIDNVITALQTYAKEYEEFNNVTDSDISKMEEYKQQLDDGRE